MVGDSDDIGMSISALYQRAYRSGKVIFSTLAQGKMTRLLIVRTLLCMLIPVLGVVSIWFAISKPDHRKRQPAQTPKVAKAQPSATPTFIPAPPENRAQNEQAGPRHFQGDPTLVVSLAFSPDGRYVLAGSADATMRLWDVQTGEGIREFEGHTQSVTSVAFSPDSRYALSGSNDNTVRLWDVQTGEELRRFEGHTNNVTSVAFSPDGHYALSGGFDGSLILWNLPEQEARARRSWAGKAETRSPYF
jgi:tricorn protease-like protein